MKRLFLVLLTLSFVNCKEKMPADRNYTALALVAEVLVVAPVEISKSELVLNQIEGKWYYKNQPYNGYSVKQYPNGTLAERLGYFNGKREGIARRWSENGVLRVESFYHQNKLVGIYKCWWENGTLSEEAHYVNGLKQGTERQWYSTGEPSKERRLVDGSEDGLQKAWLQNGKLYVNYEAKNGRIFGMKRANSCYKLEDEVVIRD